MFILSPPVKRGIETALRRKRKSVKRQKEILWKNRFHSWKKTKQTHTTNSGRYFNTHAYTRFSMALAWIQKATHSKGSIAKSYLCSTDHASRFHVNTHAQACNVQAFWSVNTVNSEREHREIGELAWRFIGPYWGIFLIKTNHWL